VVPSLHATEGVGGSRSALRAVGGEDTGETLELGQTSWRIGLAR
jgi:hypothetical protein